MTTACIMMIEPCVGCAIRTHRDLEAAQDRLTRGGLVGAGCPPYKIAQRSANRGAAQ